HGNRAITTRKSPRRWRQDSTPPRLPSVVHPVLSIVPMPPSSLPLLPTDKVKLASFPSLATLGDRYSKRFGSLSLRGVSDVSIVAKIPALTRHIEADISRCKNFILITYLREVVLVNCQLGR